MKVFCTDCRHRIAHARVGIFLCGHPESRWLDGRQQTLHVARSGVGECRPSGNLFEPKPQPRPSLWKRFRSAITPRKCEHLRVQETMACDAICRDCGRNLGFIQNWRDANKRKVGASEISNDPSSPASWGAR